MTVLQFIPLISPLSPFAFLSSLIFVLVVSLVRAGTEQIRKYMYDRTANSTEYEVYIENRPTDSRWVTKRSDQLKVGQIIKINQNERLPADLVLLAASNEDGKAFIETSSLDGEKNLKVRNALRITQILYAPIGMSDGPSIRLKNKPFVQTEEPHEQLYSFNGQIQLEHPDEPACLDKQADSHKCKQFLKINHFLYRDCVLRDTKYMIGVVAYAGRYTKTMLNGSKATSKMSKLERQVNYYMIIIFVLQLALVVLCGGLRISLYYQTEAGLFFTAEIERQMIRSYAAEWALNSSTYFILLNPLIPIALLVSIEVAKYGQGLLLNCDAFLISVKRYCKVFNSSIIEELGMVQYLFTDKTGTLTRNQMVLKQLVIAGQCYGSSEKCLSEYHKKMFFNPQLAANFSNQLDYLKHLPCQGSEQSSSQGMSNESKQTMMNSLMLLTMAVCHECSRDPESIYGFQGPSPDEIALVTSAADLGVSFEKNSLGTIELILSRFNGCIESVRETQTNPNNPSSSSTRIGIRELFEFDSNRKRMSVILQIGTGTSPHQYLLLCKGADSVIEQRLHPCHTQNPEHLIRLEYIKEYVRKFSVEGLRTLMFSYRVLTVGQYQQFKSRYSSLSETQQEEKWELISQLQTGLFLIGASGVQDKLQDAVAETISDFVRAKIKVCMLTGDKMETAENIAISCGLFKQKVQVFKISQQSPLQQLSTAYRQTKSTEQISTMGDFAIIVEGGALNSIIESTQFLYLFEHCSASIFCRITPKNKAQVVAIGKDILNRITLAIGDGANDVPMIMAANVGIGLYGNEGMNAVQASDFSIAEFKFLWRLLFVHGRWNYLRTAELIKYFFYKNILFSLCQLWFGYFCSFSGQTVYDAIYVVLYNTIFTAFPVVTRALYEQDINYIQVIHSDQAQGPLQKPKTLQKGTNLSHHELNQLREADETARIINCIKINSSLRYLFPLLYRHSQQQLSLTPRIMSLLVVQSILESLAIFLAVKYSIDLPELWTFSITVFTVVFAVVTAHICYEITYWTTMLVLFFVLSSILPFLLVVYLMSATKLELIGTFVELFKLPDFYLLLILGVGAKLALQIFFTIAGKQLFPTVLDSVRKQARKMTRTRTEGSNHKGDGEEIVNERLCDQWVSGIISTQQQFIELHENGSNQKVPKLPVIQTLNQQQ